MKLVIHPPVRDDRLRRIRDAAGPMQVVNCESEAQARRQIADADAFFGKITPQLLTRAGRLRWVQAPTASLEHYLFPELIEHSCQLTNMRGLYSDVIADHVFGYILCIARNLHVYLRHQRQRTWEPVGGEAARAGYASGPGEVSEIDLRHRHLADCTLGVVGVGSIGAEICRRGAAFGMALRGVDPVVRTIHGAGERVDVWPLERLDDLLAESDFVVIAAPHTPETEKMFRRARFEKMRKSAWLINIGRGAIVDLADLTAALTDHMIAGAALDVFETEPLPRDHPLWGLENVLITPHIAAASPRIAERHLDTLLENVRRFVGDEPLLTPADKRKWY